MKEYIDKLSYEVVIDRLKQGQQLKSDEVGSTMEIVNGILVESKSESWIINPQISKDEFLRKWYFDRPDPEISLEIGKFYKTRDGKKAYVFAVNQAGRYNVAIEGEGAYSVFSNGFYSEEEETEGDLIGLWEESKSLENVSREKSNKKLYDSILELAKKGWSIKDIAHKTGKRYNTISAYVRSHEEIYEVWKSHK